MVSINNSSRSYGSNGMLGLATGMDTESIIESMLSGTQAKIDKQNGLKQQTLWKQDIYRSVITQFHNLQKSFLDVLNPKSNLSSSSLFQSKTVNFTSNAIKVTASGTATQLKINEIKQLASGSKVVSNGTASGDLKLEIDASKLQEGASLDFTVDGVKKSFTLSGNNAEEIRANLNTDLQKSFGSALSIASDGSVSVAGNRHVTIGGNAEGLQTIGFSSEKSNKISLSTSIKNLNFDTPLAGDRFAFSINGTEFSFSSSQSLNDIMRTINNSDAGVKLSYSTLDDKFTLESTTLGSGVGIEIKESEGNLLSSMFQTAGSGAISSTTINNTNQIQGGANNLPDTLESGTFKITVNGKMHELTLAPKEDEDGNPILYTKEEVITELNAQLDAKVGKGVIVLREENGSMQMDIKGNVSVSMESEAGSLNEMLGFSDQDNHIKADSTLAELGLTGTLIIGGTSYTFQAEDTMDSIIQAFETEGIAASFTDGKLQLSTDAHTTISGDLTATLFQTNAVELNKPGADFTVQDGANAILVVNGQTIERSTNNFELDGFNITLTATSTEEINITAEDNVDQVFDTIVKFVNEYNALVDTITTLTSEKTEYRNYPPLTDAQKKEMSEKEIELWEEKAKTGLLANDATLNGILSQMRSVLFNQPEGSTISFADIGIESKNYSDRGKLTIDEDKLRNALQNNMSEVENLFTHPEHGVAVQLNKVIDQAAKASSSSPGSLVRIAGVKNSATAGTNNFSQRMDSYDKVIANLKRTYEMQKTRYWKQFSNLETVISKMNSQSSWLSQQLG